MHNRYIRALPFPPTSFFDAEAVKQIQAIPEEDIEYTEEEISWMKRAVKDIEKNLENMLRHAKLAGRGEDFVLGRKAQYQTAIALWEGKKR